MGTAWLLSLRWLKDRTHTQIVWAQQKSVTDNPPFSPCLKELTDWLTEYQSHGKGLEMDRIVNPHIHLKKWDIFGILISDHKHFSYTSLLPTHTHLISIKKQLILVRLQFKLLLHLFLLLGGSRTVILIKIKQILNIKSVLTNHIVWSDSVAYVLD